MKGIPRGRYTKEFRQEAVRLVVEEKMSWHEAARGLGTGNRCYTLYSSALGETGW